MKRIDPDLEFPKNSDEEEIQKRIDNLVKAREHARNWDKSGTKIVEELTEKIAQLEALRRLISN